MFKFEILRAAEGEGGAGGAAGEGGSGAGAGGQPGGAAGSAGDGGAAAFTGAWYDNPALDIEQEDRVFLASRNPADMKTAFKSFRDTEKLARDRNVLPKPDPTKMGEWPGWTEFGWKEDAAEYTKALKRPQMPKDLAYNSDFERHLVKIAHDNKAPVAVAQAMLDGVAEYFGKSVEALDIGGAKALEALETKLRGEWGGEYDAKVEMSKRAAQHFGVGLEDVAELEKIVGNVRVMQIFQQIGAAMGEDTLVTPGAGGGAGGLSGSQIDAELQRQAGDADFMKAFTDPGHPLHKQRRSERDALISRKAKLAG